MPLDRKFMSPKIGACSQRGPKRVAARTPFQGTTGWGGFQRRLPTGGAAKGMPRKARMPLRSATPSTVPLAVLTRSAAQSTAGSSDPATAAAVMRCLSMRLSLTQRRASDQP